MDLGASNNESFWDAILVWRIILRYLIIQTFPNTYVRCIFEKNVLFFDINIFHMIEVVLLPKNQWYDNGKQTMAKWKPTLNNKNTTVFSSNKKHQICPKYHCICPKYSCIFPKYHYICPYTVTSVTTVTFITSSTLKYQVLLIRPPMKGSLCMPMNADQKTMYVHNVCD